MSEILDRPTLVLNRHWQPVGVTPVARAVVMLWNDVARAVTPEDFATHTWPEWVRLVPEPGAPCVRASRVRVRVPEVVCLRAYDRVPGCRVTFSRRNVARRDRHTCQYCGAQPGWDALTIDHVVPRAHGGPTNWTNCVAACARCNARKADRTPEQAGMRLRARPTRPEWRPLFAVNGARVSNWSCFL